MLAAALGIAAATAHAGVPELSDRVDRACQGVKLSENAQRASPRATQCQTAKQNAKKAKTDIVLISVYSAVAAVCLTECITEKYGADTNACMITNLSAMGGELALGLVMGQEFTEILMGLATSAVPLLLSAATSAGSSGSDSSDKSDNGSCITAGMSVLKAAMKGKNLRDEKKHIETALREIEKLKSGSNQRAIDVGDGEASEVAQGGPSNPGALTRSGGSNAPQDAATDDPVDRACSSAVSGGGNGPTLSCALAQDPSLSSQLSNPAFHELLNKTSGTDLGGLAGRGLENAQAGFAASAGNGLSAKGMGAFGDVIAKHEGNVPAGSSTVFAESGPRAGGGGGMGGAGGGAGDSGNDDMSAQLAALTQQMMGAMNPEGAGAVPTNPGISQVVFAMRSSGPSTLSENPRLSLFDRVTVRYGLEAKRITEINRSNAGGP